MHTVKHVAGNVGVSEATIRVWERRYGVVHPQRSDGGYRLYTDRDIMRLNAMQALIRNGMSARLAAQEVRRRSPDFPSPNAPPTDTHQFDTHSADTDPAATARLVRAAATIDPAEAEAVLEHKFNTAEFERVVDGWLMPALEEVGHAWAQGEVDVAGEHLISAAVRSHVEATLRQSALVTTGPLVITGLPPGALHEIGILCLSVALRRLGVRTLHLGADVPTSGWRAACDLHHPTMVVLAAPRQVDAESIHAVYGQLAVSSAQHGSPAMAAGGRWQEAAPAACMRLGHQIGPAALTVALSLQSPALTPDQPR